MAKMNAFADLFCKVLSGFMHFAKKAVWLAHHRAEQQARCGGQGSMLLP
jgi:hypothetical protein